VKEGKQLHTYKTKDEVYNRFNKCLPMSMIQIDNGNYFIAGSKNICIHVKCTDYFGNISGSHYHYWHIVENETSERESQFHIQRCCLLLLRMKSTGLSTSSDESIYKVVDNS
jgi:hypothetical protein